MYSFDGKADILASLLQISVSHEPTEYANLLLKKHFLLLILFLEIFLLKYKFCKIFL